MAVEKIDPNHVYISYQGDNQDVVDKLCGLLRKKGIAYCTFQEERGKIGRIHDFEKKIGRARIKVILYSQKYFESAHCMNEYAEIREHDDCDQYVRMVNCGNVKFTRDFLMNLEKSWGNKEVDLKYKTSELKNEENAAREHRFYKDDNDKYCVQKLEKYFRGDPNYDNCYDSDLEALATDIKTFIDTYPVQTQKSGRPELHFATRRKDLIVPRKTEAQKIKKLFETESIVNMVGWGGCGKSTISEYFVNEYKEEFSQITGITINNDFYEDICKKYTGLLKVPYEYIKDRNELVERFESPIDYVATYNKILSKLEEYPIEDGKYNLIIFDVNETVGTDGYALIKDALIQIEDKEKSRLGSWKVLVISRIPLVSKKEQEFELYNVSKVEFQVLKEIFFKYLKAEKTQYYQEDTFGEGNLKKLFCCLDNCPLLVEQLAYYLSERSAQSYKQIIERLDIEGGIKTEGRMGNREASEETAHQIRNNKIRFFLSKLISFKDLDFIDNTGDIQRRIVRLFAVWERVYYSEDEVLYFLVDKSSGDDDLIQSQEDCIFKCLSKLVEKLVFDTIEDEHKTKYQIHGLIAESFREQIFVDEDNENSSFRDFSDYIAKVDSYRGKDETIQEQCIIYSLANFVSFDDEYLLKKAHKYGEANIYERALKIKYLRIKSENKITDKEIYSRFEKSDFKNSKIDEIYFNWLYKESGYSCWLTNHKPLNDKLFVKRMIRDMVNIDDGTRTKVLVPCQKRGFMHRIKSFFGSDSGFEMEEREVKGFFICRFQVTQELWYEVMEDNPSSFNKGGDYPVENVSWYDCLAFIMKINEITGLAFSFPSEKRWEYAASCGRKYKYGGTNDENLLENYAWYEKNSGYHTHRVGTTKYANDFGLYDMSGNVWEWCQDFYSSSGSSRVLRGGSRDDSAGDCRVSDRIPRLPDFRRSYCGLRLALSVPQ